MVEEGSKTAFCFDLLTGTSEFQALQSNSISTWCNGIFADHGLGLKPKLMV